MNPESGWEKGNVENKVGYLRRNELVPVPRFNDLAEENRHLLERCESDMQREHYDDDDNRFISELFEEDKARLRPLPCVPFDTALYTTATTDKYGKFTLDAGKHRYSASPAFCESIVNLKITSSAVIVMDTDMHDFVKKIFTELEMRYNGNLINNYRPPKSKGKKVGHSWWITTFDAGMQNNVNPSKIGFRCVADLSVLKAYARKALERRLKKSKRWKLEGNKATLKWNY